MTQRLVLIGGGHSHAIALRAWGLDPLPGVELVLISDVLNTAYSGMLPGYIAGFYSYAQVHIDLKQLARFAQAEWVFDRAIGLDLNNQRVICADHPAIAFDWLAIDIGSTPQIDNVPGAAAYAIPAKPVAQFLEQWQNMQQQIQSAPDQPWAIAIVGGGTGGVELALNMQAALQAILRDAQQSSENLTIHLFHRQPHLLTGYRSWISQKLEQILSDRKIKLHLLESVEEIKPVDNGSYSLHCASRLVIRSNFIVWVTQATATEWIRASGLTTEQSGFVLVNRHLQSISHANIFATGDIATIQNDPRPKAGVFAVRQGKPLAQNLRRRLLNQPLISYFPQRRYLSLIGTGDRQAIATWGNWGFAAPCLWSWKDHIDRQFMQQFKNLPE
jgi:selenide,water dikinase